MSVAVRLFESGNSIVCSLTMPLVAQVGGTITITARIDSATVVRAMHDSGIRLNPERVGSLFGNIGKVVKKVGKISAIKKALSLGKALVNSPLGKLVAPQAALAIKAAEGAAKLVAASKSKDPKKAQKAKLALAAANAQAKAETAAGKSLPLPSGIANRSPETKGAFRYLVTVTRAAA